VRLFLLPKPNSPHTLLVVSLDPPIRKGNTYYSHLLCQFNTDDEATIELDLTNEQLAARNEKVRGLLPAGQGWGRGGRRVHPRGYWSRWWYQGGWCWLGGAAWWLVLVGCWCQGGGRSQRCRHRHVNPPPLRYLKHAAPPPSPCSTTASWSAT
jgi:hypothetical protein